MFFSIFLCLKVSLGIFGCFFKDLNTDKSYSFYALIPNSFCVFIDLLDVYEGFICLHCFLENSAWVCEMLSATYTSLDLCRISILTSGVVWTGHLNLFGRERNSLLRKWLANRFVTGQKLRGHDVSCVTITVSWYQLSSLPSSVVIWAEAVQFSHFRANSFHVGYKRIIVPLSVT